MVFSKIKTRLAQKTWEKHYQIPTKLHYINTLYQDINGFSLSQQAREYEPRLDLTYGEINLYSFLALMSLAKPNKETIFCDLGAGLAKTVLAFTACYEPKLAYGMEILMPLHQQAQTIISKTPYASKIYLLNQDIFNNDWPRANLLFINVASFVPETWDKLQTRLYNYPAQTIITCVKPLKDNPFYSVYPTKVATSWGIVNAYIHRHLT